MMKIDTRLAEKYCTLQYEVGKTYGECMNWQPTAWAA